MRFEQIGAADVDLVGGKGANLGEMARAGFPVPPGFCVTAAAYRRLIDSAGLWPAMDTLLNSIPQEDTAGLEAAAARIRSLLEQAPMPAGVAEAICSAYRQLEGGAAAAAVRSSATAEDLPEASFAGQQETYLNVQGEADLLTHVQRCWASLWTARAISYRARNGFDHRQVSLAVVVQAMINPDAAGVLFTADPVTGSRNEMLINAAYGLGESIVSGRVTPDTYRISRQSPRRVVEQTCGTKEIAVRFQAGGGTVSLPVPEGDRRRFCLSPADLQMLADLGARVEEHYRVPQDIEWGLAGGRVYLLQTRPITTLKAPRPAPRRLSRLEHTILDDILEHYPDPPYPLDYRAVTEGYEQLQHLLREAGLRTPPADELIRIDDDGIPTVDPVAPRITWRLLAAPGYVRRSLAQDPSTWVREQGPRFARRLAALRDADLPALSAGALADQIEAATGMANEIARIRFATYIGPMMMRGAMIRLLVRLGGGKLQGEADLLGGLSYKSLEIDQALHRLAGAALADPAVSTPVGSLPPTDVGPALQASPEGRAFLDQVAAFLREYGARTMKVYLPFSNRSWAEDPGALWATLAALVRAGDPGAAAARTQAAGERYALWRDRVAARLPGPLRCRFLDHLERYRAGHVAREATLYAIEEAFLIARRAVREAAQRLEAARSLPNATDVLYLTLPELTGALRTPAAGNLAQTARRRRKARPAAMAAWRSALPARPAGAGDLKGLAASPGTASGQARVISGPAEFSKLQPGDILVCSFTDPAWTPLFALAAGVVSDTGGPLSHAAIVAREYGIPAVLGTQRATSELREGEEITVDGHRGIVMRAHRSTE